MASPIPLPIRQAILERMRLHEDVATIAHTLHLCPRTVRNLIRRFRQQPQAIDPSYRAGPGRGQRCQALYDRVVAMRQEHPCWGAGFIRVRLRRLGLGEVPSERTLQRWLRQEQQPPAAPGRRPAAQTTRATQPHQGWQMDAAEQFRLKNQQGVCWLRLVDEHSGAFLSTTVFPPVLLGSRRRGGGSAAAASGFCPLGPAAEHPCGQWQAVGVVE